MRRQWRVRIVTCLATICAELKGVTTGTPVHSCADCIKDAAAIVEEVLLGGENE